MNAALLWSCGLTLLAGMVQSTCVPSIHGEWPDLVLVTIVLLSLQGGARQGLTAGVVGGLFMGLATGKSATAFLLSHLVTASMVVRLRRSWQIESLFIQVLVVLAATIGEMVLFGLLYPEVLGRPRFLDHLVLRCGLNIAATVPLSWLLSRLPTPKASVVD